MATYGVNNFGQFPLTTRQGVDEYINALSAYPTAIQGSAALPPILPPVAPAIATPQSFAVGQPAGMGMWDSFKNWINDSGMMGSTDMKTGIKTDGWGGMALGAAQGIGNAFMGMQQYQLAKDTFNENKRQFNLNFEAQRKTTNAALEDRQRARVASNSGAYQSVGDYMTKYGV